MRNNAIAFYALFIYHIIFHIFRMYFVHNEIVVHYLFILNKSLHFVNNSFLLND